MVNLSLKSSQRAHPLLYVGIAVAIAIWSAAVLCFAINIVPLDVYWMSYYAVDYTFGFVRRGLAGELVGLVPGHYFAVSLGLRWLSVRGADGADPRTVAETLRSVGVGGTPLRPGLRRTVRRVH